MDLRTRTSLFCGVLALAIATSILLRGQKRRAQIFLALFAADIGLWYLAQWLYQWIHADVWARFTAALAVLLPLFALNLFEAILPDPARRSKLVRLSGILMVPILLLVSSPQHRHGLARGAVFVYVFGFIAAGLFRLEARGRRSGSRATQRRVRFLVLIGAAAAAFTLADFLWFIGAPLPPVGAVLSIVFLFVLAESMTRERLIDLLEILGQLLVSTALAFCLAGLFYVFVVLFGGFETMYLGAILAAIVILLLVEPLREKVEGYIQRAFFIERIDLERALADARGELTHVLQVDEMSRVVIAALEDSRRATAAALYVRDASGSDFVLTRSFGPTAPLRIEAAAARPLIELLTSSPAVLLEQIKYELLELRREGWNRQVELRERALAAAEVLGPFKEGICMAVHGEGHDLIGILALVDERVRDAFSPDEVGLLESLAVQIGIVIENSQQYQRMQERDRLAVLGQMAAGLAHEVKNPLGAIKGAAQLLSEPASGKRLDNAEREFVGIILEEVERLDRTVGSVLNYARPSKGEPGALDVNQVVLRTLQVLASDRSDECEFRTDLATDLPVMRADAEQLRQVLMNLVQNAMQAAKAGGVVTVSTALTRARRAVSGRAAQAEAWIEIDVTDDGPGIDPKIVEKVFLPFFTTKDRGTGLGLAISQRMVQEMGGFIEVRSPPGAGATFAVFLPALGDDRQTPRPSESALRASGSHTDSTAAQESSAIDDGAGPAHGAAIIAE